MKNKKISALILGTLISSMCLTGCTSSSPIVSSSTTPTPTQTIETTTTPEPTTEVTPTISTGEVAPTIELSANSNISTTAMLADELYDGSNLLISPLSLNTALGLLEGGTSGGTKEQLDAYLGNVDYGNISRFYADKEDDFVKISNAVWVSDEYTIKSEYEKYAIENYLSSISTFDNTQSDETANRINDWTAENTNQLIKKIVKPTDIEPTTRMILTNALYFKSTWSNPWDVYSGYKFTTFDGKTKTIEGISNQVSKYYENDKASAFAALYKDDIYFVGILPNETGDFNLSDLDIDGLLQSENTDYSAIYATMPKIKYETTYEEIVDALMGVGLTSIFTEGDEMNGFVEENGLHTNKIVQKCTIELDENGTTASAATAIIMKDNSIAMMPTDVMNIDLNRPYAYLIYDMSTNQVLFMGKVVDFE